MRAQLLLPQPLPPSAAAGRANSSWTSKMPHRSLLLPMAAMTCSKGAGDGSGQVGRWMGGRGLGEALHQARCLLLHPGIPAHHSPSTASPTTHRVKLLAAGVKHHCGGSGGGRGESGGPLAALGQAWGATDAPAKRAPLPLPALPPCRCQKRHTRARAHRAPSWCTAFCRSLPSRTRPLPPP